MFWNIPSFRAFLPNPEEKRLEGSGNEDFTLDQSVFKEHFPGDGGFLYIEQQGHCPISAIVIWKKLTVITDFG